MCRVVRISQKDNVAVVLHAADKGEGLVADGCERVAAENIPMGHKVALECIDIGQPVIKYGYPIGVASRPIVAGQWVHSHNVKTSLTEDGEYSYRPDIHSLPMQRPAIFQGYLRADGRAGVRNEVWIIPTVGCVNGICTQIARQTMDIATGKGVDGVYAFPHPYGCSQMGNDHATTRKLLAALCHNPNAGGVLVVGLGCENNTMEDFKKELGSHDADRFRFMVCQQEEDELAAGVRHVQELLDVLALDRRQPLPASQLVVGMKCGGSDGLSGITANAVVGAFSDRLISMGGSTILTEVPEMFGAEAILLNRCATQGVYGKAVEMINGFKAYFVRHGQVVYENPSPGNKDGGITTLEDKSLGCVQKGGTAPVVDVLDYGEQIREKGLILLNGPGNDLVSTTALTAAGAQIILFTTGRGTPFGAPAVTLKISSNSTLAHNKPNWIDFDAGVVSDGRSIPETADRLLEHVLRIASGEELCRAEKNGYREIAILKDGVTL